MIKLTDVEKSFSQSVIDKASFTVEKGTTTGLVGLNGAGKTTLLRLVLGLYAPTDGSVEINGRNPQTMAASHFQSIGVVGDCDGFNGNLTFLDNLLFYGGLLSVSQREIKQYAQENWEHLLGIRKVKVFSKGERMQCSLARAFLGSPDLYVFDEPTTSLDYEGYLHFCSLVKKEQQRGATFLISSHNLEAVEELCGEVLLLENRHIEKLPLSKKLKNYKLVCSSIKKACATLDHEHIEYSEDGDSITLIGVNKRSAATIVTALVQEEIAVYQIAPIDTVAAVLHSIKKRVQR